MVRPSTGYARRDAAVLVTAVSIAMRFGPRTTSAWRPTLSGIQEVKGIGVLGSDVVGVSKNGNGVRSVGPHRRREGT